MSFGYQGGVYFSVGDSPYASTALGVQPDGKILATANNVYKSALARFLPNGKLDPGFHGYGFVKILCDTNICYFTTRALAIQPDGKILVAGDGEVPQGNGYIYRDFAIIRYNDDGSSDTSFGTAGMVRTHFELKDGQTTALVVQPDGKIIAAGFSTDYHNQDFALVRYNPNGAPDSTFGTGGTVMIDFNGSQDQINAMTLLPDGKIAVAGYSFDGNRYQIALAQLLPNGAPDPGFGTNGKTLVNLGPGNQQGQALAWMPDGNWILAGRTDRATDPDFLLARFQPNGAIDSSFAENGSMATSIGASEDIVYATVLQPDHKIIAAGTTCNGLDDRFALARYLPDGTLDPGFGVDGKVCTTFGTGDGFHSVAYAAALQPDGKILAGGVGSSNTNNLYKNALARYLPDGHLDSTFGTYGKIITSFNNLSSESHALALQPDGRILAAGFAGTGFGLTRYLSDGIIDSTFGLYGQLTTTFTGMNAVANGVAVRPDGRILLAGVQSDNSGQSLALARYNIYGALDLAFGTNGTVTSHIGGSKDGIRAMALQPDGNIVTSGYTLSPTTQQFDFGLTRYKPNGTVDNSGNSGGKLSTPIGQGDSYSYSVNLQPDGNILQAGYAFNGTNYDFALARYHPDLSLDHSFGTGGKVVAPIGSSQDYAYASVLQPDGNIVLAGKAVTDGSAKFALARFVGGGDVATHESLDAWTALSVTPNPVQDRAVVKFTLEQAGAVRIRLVGVDGKTQCVLAGQAWVEAGAHELAVAVPVGLANGAYWVVVDGMGASVKIVVVR
jgi:uncharacterized delta-60 repeat protein